MFIDLIDFYYNEDEKRMTIQFSTKRNSDLYRVLELSYHDVTFYSSDIIDEDDLSDASEDFIKDLIENYSNENDLPQEQLL